MNVIFREKIGCVRGRSGRPMRNGIDGKLLTEEGLYKNPNIGNVGRRLILIETEDFLVERDDVEPFSKKDCLNYGWMQLKIERGKGLENCSVGIQFQELGFVFAARFRTDALSTAFYCFFTATFFWASAFGGFFFLATMVASAVKGGCPALYLAQMLKQHYSR